MGSTEPPFTVGIEEEYLLVDLDTRDVNENPPPRLLRACTELGAGQINPDDPAFQNAQKACGSKLGNVGSFSVHAGSGGAGGSGSGSGSGASVSVGG